MEQEKKNKQIIDVHALLEDILREARRLRVWALVLILVCALGLCAYRYITYSPRYQATASFTVKVGNPSQAGVSAYNSETAEQMAKTFPYLLTSGVLQQKVKEQLGVSSLPSIQAEALPSSNIFTLKVTSSDPEWAYEVLRAVITYYPEVADFVVGPTELYLLNESGVPAEPYNSRDLVTPLWQGAVAGLAVWLVIVLVLAVAMIAILRKKKR